MAMNNHMEARRRQIFMERVCAARKRLELAQQEQENKEGTSNVYTSQSDPMQSKENGPSKTARFSLAPFRGNEEGHRNKYRNRQHLAPHCEKAFAVMYPGCDNVDYVVPETRRNIRENHFVDKIPNGEQTSQFYAIYTPSQTKKLLTAVPPPNPKPCPPSLEGVKRDHVYKILHPHSEY